MIGLRPTFYPAAYTNLFTPGYQTIVANNVPYYYYPALPPAATFVQVGGAQYYKAGGCGISRTPPPAETSFWSCRRRFEFGRSPQVVNAGRDHWPACYSALMAGAGVGGGLVYGASDRHGGYVRDNAVSPEDFGATLFHALGVPPETRLGADGFTRPASAGRPIAALLG